MKYDDMIAMQKAERRRPAHMEDKLQIACVQWFSYQYTDYIPFLHHSPNGGWRTKAEAGRFKAMGTRAGFPDLLLWHPNRFYPFMGIELKTPSGRQSAEQKEMQKRFEGIGASYVIVRTLEDFIDVVTSYMEAI